MLSETEIPEIYLFSLSPVADKLVTQSINATPEQPVVSGEDAHI